MRKARLDRRGKTILSVAVAVAVVVNASVAWAYWSLSGSGNAVSVAGSAVELELNGRSDESKPLYPGGSTNLTVTVTNKNDFPIKITTVSPGPGSVTADASHRDAGCRSTGVFVASDVLRVAWEVPKNTIGVFTVSDGLKMNNSSDSACQGATFSIPVRATGVSNAS
ncbi:hypothetical protein [Mangrovihabitans endophyticus]|uniref:Uncharacterized protein n=1 Tax=Mangrovihabitans endophyticus TaxID=1751298 RepID=A0A8J3C3Y9_9ACTN|nr:hypothetical protein [Mangrovihabitans endophyticus]GGL04701.1 hypothetical protein GCM10012284_44100 [Mangrovihabitans endophyticus]